MTVFEVHAAGQGVVRTCATRVQAESFAERIGADVREAEVTVGQRVQIRFHGHVRPGRVVGFTGIGVDVEFVARQGTAAVVRTFPVGEVSR